MAGNSTIKRVSLFTISAFYIFAGVNHFINPEFYLPLIPPYFPFHEAINLGSGVLEIVLGMGVLISRFRRLVAFAIIAMLICFIPSHVYFIQQGGCLGDLCVAEWVGYVRLYVIHPILILWAYWHKD
ncbi:MAG: putative membrane protein [Marinoscillum sp.]|jgi:uncharacterized membrane protein